MTNPNIFVYLSEHLYSHQLPSPSVVKLGDFFIIVKKNLFIPIFLLPLHQQIQKNMFRLKECMNRATENGLLGKKRDLAQTIWAGSSEKSARMNLSNLSNGKSQRIDIRAVPIICAKLGVTADYLFGISDNPTPDASRQAIADKAREIIETTKSL